MKSGNPVPFRAPRETIDSLDPESVARMAIALGDLVLVVDRAGLVLDVAFGNLESIATRPDDWIGRRWVDLVSADSRAKIGDMMTAAFAGEAPRWRHVNHAARPDAPGGPDVPIRYLAVAAHGSGRVLAIGQDLRANAALQQRLIQAQQSIERDYLKLRQTEARYRLLFDLDADPVLVIDAETRRIREANPAATALVKAKPGTLVGRPLAALFAEAAGEGLAEYLGTVSVVDGTAPVFLGLATGHTRVALSATAFRQDRAAFFLVRLHAPDGAAGEAADQARMRELIERLPDAFVLVDPQMKIVTANAAFLDLSQEVSPLRLKGVPLGNYVGRAGIDIDLIVDQLREHSVVRNVATIIRGKDGSIEEVELSGVTSPGADGDGFGFSIRTVGRRVAEPQGVGREVPRSVEQLTELVGRMSLKDIVRESTDLIERLCIEAALEYTSDNRASAAEILGVSRQSLYSKLHRHGLGNLVPGED